jgi:hypothetical protein
MTKRKFQKIVNQFVKGVNKEYSVRYGDEFIADFKKKQIDISLENDNYDGLFMANIYRKGGGKNLPLLDCFTWSLLHELGHLENAYRWNDDSEPYTELFQKYTGVLLMEHYIKLPNERVATKWAINYVKKNKTYIKKWNKLFVLAKILLEGEIGE